MTIATLTKAQKNRKEEKDTKALSQASLRNQRGCDKNIIPELVSSKESLT